jgi:hypothetical protein
MDYLTSFLEATQGASQDEGPGGGWAPALAPAGSLLSARPSLASPAYEEPPLYFAASAPRASWTGKWVRNRSAQLKCSPVADAGPFPFRFMRKPSGSSEWQGHRKPHTAMLANMEADARIDITFEPETGKKRLQVCTGHPHRSARRCLSRRGAFASLRLQAKVYLKEVKALSYSSGERRLNIPSEGGGEVQSAFQFEDIMSMMECVTQLRAYRGESGQQLHSLVITRRSLAGVWRRRPGPARSG